MIKYKCTNYWKPKVRAKQFKNMKSIVWGFSDAGCKFAKGRRLNKMSHHFDKHNIRAYEKWYKMR